MAGEYARVRPPYIEQPIAKKDGHILFSLQVFLDGDGHKALAKADAKIRHQTI
jgi:hypothetical protein